MWLLIPKSLPFITENNQSYEYHGIEPEFVEEVGNYLQSTNSSSMSRNV